MYLISIEEFFVMYLHLLLCLYAYTMYMCIVIIYLRFRQFANCCPKIWKTSETLIKWMNIIIVNGFQARIATLFADSLVLVSNFMISCWTTIHSERRATLKSAFETLNFYMFSLQVMYIFLYYKTDFTNNSLESSTLHEVL